MIPARTGNPGTPDLVEAVCLWTGWGRSAAPTRDDDAIVRRFGRDAGEKLLSVIRRLEDDFYFSNARHVAVDLEEMGRLAREQFKQKHPSVADDIAAAFAWCYTFDFK